MSRQPTQPHLRLQDDIKAIYTRGKVVVGLPSDLRQVADPRIRPHTCAVIGMQYGDEGKGRILDNKLGELLKIRTVKKVYVDRFQGGSNAGHTIYTQDGQRIPLHQLPSGILYSQASGIMDSGMVIEMGDLQIEIQDAEAIVGDLRGKLVLSQEAILCTDLERAEEVLNGIVSEGASAGGTGRGISPAYAHFYDRRGKQIHDLFAKNWKEAFADRYDDYALTFRRYKLALSDMNVPDLRATRTQQKAVTRTVGSQAQYLQRLENIRTWYLDRDASLPGSKKLIQNTFMIHQQIYQDLSVGVMFEGAQAVGLHAWLGRRPDVTSSDTSLYGIQSGTKWWLKDNIEESIGVFKITYMSSVGRAHVINQIDIPREKISEAQLKKMSPEQQQAVWIRTVAKETGTTSGRFRDICYLDLPLMRYNIRMGGVDTLAGTHLDIAKQDVKIQVCTHYEDAVGDYAPYQPGVVHQQALKPHYEYFPSWDGDDLKQARQLADLPDNAKKFLAFIQRQTGCPIVCVTTGPYRDDMIFI